MGKLRIAALGKGCVDCRDADLSLGLIRGLLLGNHYQNGHLQLFLWFIVLVSFVLATVMV